MKHSDLAFVILLNLLLIIGVIDTAGAQLHPGNGDYSRRPMLEVHYIGMEASLEIGFEQHRIRGEVDYRIRPKHAYVDYLHWPSYGINIIEVTSNGEPASFRMDNDSLKISFNDYLPEENIINISIVYETEPVFGVHFTHNSTAFSSTLPGSVAHWLPGPIHPRVAMPINLSMEVPEGFSVVATGSLDEKAETDQGHRFTWVTSNDVPISELSFAAGRFQVSEAYYGTKTLRLYFEEGILDEDEEQSLLQSMALITRDLEMEFQSELPVRSFQTVVLEDDRWEARPYAAGMAFLFNSRGDFEAMLLRALAAQWFGIALRPEQWQDSEFYLLLQALTTEKYFSETPEIPRHPMAHAFSIPVTLYNKMSTESWYHTVSNLDNSDFPILYQSMRSLTNEWSTIRDVWTSHEFSSELYKVTGRWMVAPDLSEPIPDPLFEFKVSVERVEGGNIELNITPEADIIGREFEIGVHKEYDGRVESTYHTFNGLGDVIEIGSGNGVSNIIVENTDNRINEIFVVKPFEYWFYQLRRDESPSRRKQAAVELVELVDDPDLQLAFQDMLNNEDSPEVLEAIYNVIARITYGARGTEQFFFEGLDHRYIGVRKVSMEALGIYQDNEQVIQKVLSIIQTSDDIPLVNTAIRTYRQLLDDDEFRDFALQFLEEDLTERLFTRTLLEELYAVPVTDDSVISTIRYLEFGFPFDIRWLAYRLLREHAEDFQWQKDFLLKYSDDPDPRIRFLALYSLPALDIVDRGPFLEDRMLKEYDIRILQRAQELNP
ncbi:MAG: hypothetical protein WD097_00825 [Balneolales bacterium]